MTFPSLFLVSAMLYPLFHGRENHRMNGVGIWCLELVHIGVQA